MSPTDPRAPAATHPDTTAATTPPSVAPHAPHDASEWLLLIVPGLIWGASFLFIAEGLRAVGPNGITFLRIAVGFLALGCAPVARRSIAESDWRGVTVLGVVWFAFPLSMFPYAEQRVSSAVTGMLNGGVPLATAVVASLMARRLPARGVMTGLGIGLVGVVLVALPSLGEGTNSAFGVALIAVAISSYGLAVNIARPLQDRNGALPIIWRAQAVALVLTAPLGLREALDAHWSLLPLLSIVALGALGTGLAYVMLSFAGARMGTTRASATTFLVPGVALALGVVVRGERVAALSVLGAAVCVAGAWWMRRAALPAPDADPATTGR